MKLLFLTSMIFYGTLFAANQQLALQYHGMTVQVAAHNPDGSVDVQVLQVQDSFAAMEACDEFENLHNKTIDKILLIYVNGSSLVVEGDDGVHIIDMGSAVDEID